MPRRLGNAAAASAVDNHPGTLHITIHDSFPAQIRLVDRWGGLTPALFTPLYTGKHHSLQDRRKNWEEGKIRQGRKACATSRKVFRRFIEYADLIVDTGQSLENVDTY